MTENLEEMQKLENLIIEKYKSILSSSPENELLEFRKYDLYTLLYKYFERFIFNSDPELNQDFYEAISEDFFKTEKKGNKHYSTLLENILNNKISPENFIEVFKKNFSKKIKHQHKKNFWFHKSGGAKIGEKTLRKIDKGESKYTFSVESQYKVTQEQEETDLFESLKASEHNKFNNTALIIDEESDVEEINRIIGKFDEKFIKETTYKVSGRQSIPDKIKKPYLGTIITWVVIAILTCMRRVPKDTAYAMLEQRRFFDRTLYDDWIKNGKIKKQKEIALWCNTTEKQIVTEKKSFFRTLDREDKKFILSIVENRR